MALTTRLLTFVLAFLPIVINALPADELVVRGKFGATRRIQL